MIKHDGAVNQLALFVTLMLGEGLLIYEFPTCVGMTVTFKILVLGFAF
jgi:hypothetical protein